ncbi:hypothetical protein [Paenibacillus sp. Soil787]|nr:hypothetical protein [Paenibacillus sp. Soil787]
MLIINGQNIKFMLPGRLPLQQSKEKGSRNLCIPLPFFLHFWVPILHLIS